MRRDLGPQRMIGHPGSGGAIPGVSTSQRDLRERATPVAGRSFRWKSAGPKPCSSPSAVAGPPPVRPPVLSNDVGINPECIDGSCIGNDRVEDRNLNNLTETVPAAGDWDTGIFGTADPGPPWPPPPWLDDVPLFSLRLLTLLRDCLTLSRHCTWTASRDTERRFRWCPERNFSKGTASFIIVTVGKVPDSAPFVWLVLEEKLKTRFRPTPCRSGEKRNFSKRSASFLIDTVGDERVW